MDEFEYLLHIADRLLGPEGCPWDHEQTFFTLQTYLLEETHELIEAIDTKRADKILEELGDVLYILVFIAKLGEKEKKFTMAQSIRAVTEKLIRRHPHVFGDQKIFSAEEVLNRWEEVKKQEGKKNPIADIPPTLPALARAQKVIHKLRRQKSAVLEEVGGRSIGHKLWDLVQKAEAQGIDAESALRRTCLAYEEKFKKHRR